MFPSLVSAAAAAVDAATEESVASAKRGQRRLPADAAGQGERGAATTGGEGAAHQGGGGEEAECGKERSSKQQRQHGGFATCKTQEDR